MRFDVAHLRRYCACLTCIAVLFAASAAQAGVQYVVTDREAVTLTLPGGFAYLSDLYGTPYDGDGEDIYGYPMPYTALLVILDTGASGNLICATEAASLEIPYLYNPTTGEKEEFTDVGIGGYEDFYVSDSMKLHLAPMSSDMYEFGFDEYGELVIVDNTENHDLYSEVGTLNFQVRQSDPVTNIYGYDEPVMYNIVGTPVLNQGVMHVTPNNSIYTTLVPAIDYVQTELIGSAPDLSSTPGVLRVQLNYQNFIADPTYVTTSTNPMIDGVQASLGAKSTTGEWLLDTGAMLTIMGTDMAEDLDIVVGVGWDTTMEVSGVGSGTITLYGYTLDSLTIPLIGGDELVFEDIVVFVSAEDYLPANLPGILGMNVLGQSYDPDDQYGYFFPTASAFSDFYVDYANSELVLVLGETVPEPGTFALLAVGALVGLAAVVRRRRAG